MKKSLLALPLCLLGCAGSNYVRAGNTTLGRVVVYRNGVAYFERTARVDDDVLKMSVPADKIDDFLKSLTVTDKLSQAMVDLAAFEEKAMLLRIHFQDGVAELSLEKKTG